MTDQILLAKSLPSDGQDDINMHLISHLKHTYWAAKAIWENIGDSLLKAIGVDSSQNQRFERIFLLAAATHDLGKANSLFQGVVRGKNIRQSIRHEWLLYILLRRSPMGDWLRTAFDDETDFTYFVWTVIGHHRKNSNEKLGDYSGMELYCQTNPFRGILDWIAEEFCLSSPELFINGEKEKWENLSKELKTHSTTIANLLSEIKNTDLDFNDDDYVFFTLSEKSFMGSLRSLLMTADVAASAMADPDFPERGDRLNEDKINHWITEYLTNVVPSRRRYEEIISTRERIIEVEKGSSSVNEKLDQARAKFQKDVASSKTRVTLVSAGCGSGKTLAAFRWGANQCGKDGNRMFFCYPTTGTATEGFLGYLLDDQNHSMGDLVHSRVSVDFLLNERMRNRTSDDEDHRQTIVKSLGLWGTGLVCCTVDTVLGFLVNTYSGHLSIPAFARSIFVFDEIHSYDDNLFGNLLRFLQTFRGLPILLMTASLPKHRLEQIQEAVETRELTIIPGPETWERIKRYQQTGTVDAPTEEVLKLYRNGQKILWVCNTVGRAIKFAEELKTLDPNCNLIVYHSHFRYIDRCSRHSECVHSFADNKPVICITTQVAEMSLDISADFLVSDIAPIPSFIQRLGRLNRRAVTDNVNPFLVLRPKNQKGEPFLFPYTEEVSWWEKTELWLEKLGQSPLSQADLVRWWETMGFTGTDRESPSTPAWAMGPDVNRTNLRKLANYSCEVVLKKDWEKIKKGGKTAYQEYAIPMTVPRFIPKPVISPQYGCIIVEQGVNISYDPMFGAQWINPKDNSKSAPDGIDEMLIF